MSLSCTSTPVGKTTRGTTPSRSAATRGSRMGEALRYSTRRGSLLGGFFVSGRISGESLLDLGCRNSSTTADQHRGQGLALQQALQQRLTDTQQRLRTLQQGGQPGQTNAAAGISPAQQSEIERFRHELTETRAKIREVQRNLRASVDQLGSLLSFMNIALVPLLVAAFAIVLALLRRRRRARAIAF